MAKKAEEKKVVATPEKEAKKTVKKTAAPKKAVAKKETVKKTVKKAAVKETPVKEEVVKEVKEPKKEALPGSKVTVEELFEAGAHFGHVVKKWNPKMKKYLWGEKNGIHIFDLEKTVECLDEACKEVIKLASTGKRIVLVGTKRQAKQMVEDAAKKAGVPYITQRWMGGLITNWRQVKQTIDRLVSLKTKRDSGQLKKYTKKEQVLFDREISRLERVVGGLVNLKDVPEAVIVIDTHKEKLAVKEAKSVGITVIGLVDSNSDPDMVDYPIPMNDDSAKALEIVIGALEGALETGLKELKK
ncbi:MAG TPA: 30S ribosomal protein S2 [Patescibacteria group bacterium]